MGRRMTEVGVRSFMGTGSRTGKLATVRANGRPHIAAVWFDFDTNGDVMFLTREDSVKARNMRRDPRVSLLVDDDQMPFAWARIDGTVAFDDDPQRLVHWATETCRRYVGDDLAEAYGRRNGVPGELVVRLTPGRLVGETGVAD